MSTTDDSKLKLVTFRADALTRAWLRSQGKKQADVIRDALVAAGAPSSGEQVLPGRKRQGG